MWRPDTPRVLLRALADNLAVDASLFVSLIQAPALLTPSCRRALFSLFSRMPPQCVVEYARRESERLGGVSSVRCIVVPFGSEYESTVDGSLSAFARLLTASLSVYSTFSRPTNVSVVDYTHTYTTTCVCLCGMRAERGCPFRGSILLILLPALRPIL